MGNLGGVFVPWTIGVIGDSWSLGLGLAASALCPVLILVILSAMARLQAPETAVAAA